VPVPRRKLKLSLVPFPRTFSPARNKVETLCRTSAFRKDSYRVRPAASGGEFNRSTQHLLM